MNQATVYVWDEQLALTRGLCDVVRDVGCPMVHVRDPADGRATIERTARGVCVICLPNERSAGWELLAWVTVARPSLPSIVVVGSSDGALAAWAGHLGARVVLAKEDCSRHLIRLIADCKWFGHAC